MKLATKSEEKYRKYWLNELSESEQELIEEQYFTDAEVFESVLAAKQSLVDDYHAQRFSPAQQPQFEAFFCASSSQRFDRQLLQALSAQVL